MSDPETISVYNEQADKYANIVSPDALKDPHLEAFIKACASGGHVLDLGCGPGASSAIMADAGLRVDATDASEVMIDKAAKHPGVTAWQASFDQIAGEDLYDGIWASFSLLHAPRDSFPTHLSALHKALKPGAPFVIGLKLGTGMSRDRLGRLYTYYTESELTARLTESGFTVAGHDTGRGPGLDGTDSDWIVMRAHG